jgi:acyl-CoA thioester hydrolase
MLTYRGTVYPWHCDHMGHMNVMWYVGKFDEATWQLFNSIGLRPASLRAAGRGMAAVEQRITYARELLAGTVVSITTKIDGVYDRKIRFTHEMRNDDSNEVAASTTILGVHLDMSARKACSLPLEVVNCARALLLSVD